MKTIFCSSLVLLITFFVEDSYGHFSGKGHVHTRSKTQQVFLNPNCRSTDTCDLKRFALTTVIYEVWFRDDPNHPSYSNGVIMEYETSSVDALEKYAIVQFVRGCVFHSSKNREGRIDRNLSYLVPSFGERVPFCFPEWVIDSHDTDPAYNSDPEYGRFYLLRWNHSGSYDYRTQKYYGVEKPKNPIVYMTDYPAGAFVTGTGVKNAALEFTTCIYRAGDVPTKTRRDNINFAKPLACFEWQNVYVYDFASGKFKATMADLPLPGPEEPYARVNRFPVVTFVTTFALLALFVFLRLKQTLRCPLRKITQGKLR